MLLRPVALHIEETNMDTGENQLRDALRFHLKMTFGCDVLEYDNTYYSEYDESSIIQEIENGLLIFAIISEKSSGSYDIQKFIKKIHKISPKLPIVVIPDLSSSQKFLAKPNNLIFVWKHRDPEFLTFIERQCQMFNQWLKQREASYQVELLEQAYRNNYLGDNEETMAGIPNHNDQAIIEYLRIRLLPAEAIKGEFEDALSYQLPELPKIEETIFNKEEDRIVKMSRKERKEFENDLLQAEGYEVDDAVQDIIYKRNISSGAEVIGLAIDPVTLEIFATNRIGLHKNVKQILAHRIINIKMYLGKESTPDDSEDYESRIISGLVVNVEGFSCPILVLHYDCWSNEDYKKAALYLRSQRKYLVVTPEGELITNLTEIF